MEIRTVGSIAEVQVDKNLRVTRAWTKLSKPKAKALRDKKYKGRPLYEVRDPKATTAADKSATPIFEETQWGPSEQGDTEDNS